MAGWHHRLNGNEFEQAPGDGEGQGSLACCSPCGCKDLGIAELLKKMGKTTRPFRYDLNQIPYDYTVEMRNRFKVLDVIDRVPDELWMEVCDIVQETGIKTIPKKKKCKKAKWLSEEALTNSCEKKRSQKQSRKGKIYPFECRVANNSKER